MMFRTKHKYFNNKIKMLLLILMWALMGRQHRQHQPAFYGEASTYDDSNVSVYVSDDDDGRDVAPSTAPASTASFGSGYGDMERGYEAIKEYPVRRRTMRMPLTLLSTATNTVFEDGHNNAAIYGDINENDNKSNKLPQNIWAKETKEEQPTTTSPSSSAVKQHDIPAMDQLNGKNYVYAPGDDGKMNTACTNDARSKDNKTNDETIDECGKQWNVSQEATKQVSKDMAVGNDTGPDIGNGDKEEHSMFTIQSQMIRELALRFKKIIRLTLFTCQDPGCRGNECKDNTEKLRRSQKYKQTLKLLNQLFSLAIQNPDLNSKSLLIKVVHIDHLKTKRRLDSNKANPRGRFADRSNAKNVGRSNDRNPASNPNWLDQVLQGEYYRQLLVVDLSCGESSHRLLEMASNKALFNSVYHWLLMEDYAFNRQTEIDDTDDISKKKMNSSSSNANIPASTTTTYSSNRNTDKEVVNNSHSKNSGIDNRTKSAMLVKELYFSSSTSDVVGASASGLPARLNKRQSSVPTTSGGGGAGGAGGIRRGLGGKVAAKSSIADTLVAGETDEDDMEIIEKFLEQLNININTELILAKRRMRSIIPADTSNCSSHFVSPIPDHLNLSTFASVSVATTSGIEAQSIMMPSVASSVSCSAPGDYNTLQKMDYYILYDVWSPGRQYGGDLNISEVGMADSNQGVQLDEWYRRTSFVLRRKNMHLARIRCQIVVTHKDNKTSLYDYLTSHNDTHLDSMHRFNFALLSKVRDLFNFSFSLSKTPTWGYLKNGKFDGMIGALIRNQADIGGSPTFFRIERAKVIDYTTGTWVARPCFIFRHPRSTKRDRIVFLQPFSNDVWILLAACGVLTILLLWLLTTLEPEDNRRSVSVIPAKIVPGGSIKRRLIRWSGILCGYDINHETTTTQRVGLWLESVLFYLGSICQQGLTFATSSFAGRCIVITSLLFSFAIYQFYSASIVGTLLLEKPKTIRTLRDLIHSSLEIGIEDIPYTRDFFLRTKDPDAQELYAKKITNVPTSVRPEFGGVIPDILIVSTTTTTTPMPLTDKQKAKALRDILHSHESGAHAKSNEASNWYEPEFGVAKIKRGRFAFHVDIAAAYKLISETFTEKEICDLTEIQLFPPGRMVSIVQKGSPLRKPISYGLRRLSEVGIEDYERKFWHSAKPRCVRQIHMEDLQVDMQTFTSALLVLLFGLIISGLILSLEMVHHRKWQRYTTTIN
ncbi:ionotropic receptor 64a [Haematobia irritans]|uniref:ionotropic receptor 64a n=1 Tax=Haematobia irritans TaxID=7368 RepID=UPI003F4F9AB7